MKNFPISVESEPSSRKKYSKLSFWSWCFPKWSNTFDVCSRVFLVCCCVRVMKWWCASVVRDFCSRKPRDRMRCAHKAPPSAAMHKARRSSQSCSIPKWELQAGCKMARPMTHSSVVTSAVFGVCFGVRGVCILRVLAAHSLHDSCGVARLCVFCLCCRGSALKPAPFQPPRMSGNESKIIMSLPR